MRRLASLILICVLASFLVPQETDAQGVLNGIYVKYRDQQRKPIPYKPLREADVMWSKFIMRRIDLREKLNEPLYYPTKPILERMSLIDLMLHGIKNEGLTAYASGDPGEEFNVPMTWREIEEKFDVRNDTSQVMDVETGEMIDKVITKDLNSFEVKQYLVKEMWYFDRKYSTLNVRIIALSPIREYNKEITGDMSAESIALAEESAGEATQRQLFWVSFVEFRPLFANHEVMNPYNDSERRSFDDIFFKRKFASYIVQESNIYDNRNINSYSLGQNTLLESERIKNWVFNLEQDVWEY
ncbi:MAG: gliding motility protein GldN [Bacteroidales bacterium]|nr:gliding motility protein GldN [Bacteroidales bacterium]MCF8455964.1 gliding motility protein GldN [Bacteroidales bacterium]